MTENMGAVTKAEVEDFAHHALAVAAPTAVMEWTPASPSICLGNKILIREDLVGQYPWQAKEEVLHEMAHLNGLSGHGMAFYEVYIALLKQFMVGQE